MVALNFNSLCKEAEPYYYDFLCEEAGGIVPNVVIDHINHCQHCQEQLSRLTCVLSITESNIGSDQRQVSSAITTMLKLHLAYSEKPVTCDSVKPFLPSLLDPALELGVPTPITVHLDNCQKCSEELETICRLNISRRQLRRLSQLFADKPVGSDISCIKVQNAIPSIVSMVFNETDSEVLKHLCVCPDCREMLYQRREMVLRGLLKTSAVESKFPCSKVLARDFFDYVVPYGLNPSSDQYAKFRESFTSHLRTCPTCLTKMQELHETIYGIYERAGSDVVTIYRIDESAKAKTAERSDIPYAGFPVKVEVRRYEEEEAVSSSPTIDFGAALKQKTSVANLKPLLKTAAVAAAIVLIAAVLFQNISTARAVTLERIYEAVEKIRNVHITVFTPPEKESVQELWMSKTLNIYMTKTARQFVLWDITNRTRKAKQLDIGIIGTYEVTDSIIESVKRKTSSVLDLMPFYSISDIPEDSYWSRVADEDLEIAADGIEVYDLTWTERAYDGLTVLRKWRVFVNSKTNLPQKIEWYEKSAADSEYNLSPMMVVEYLSEGEILRIIKDASF